MSDEVGGIVASVAVEKTDAGLRAALAGWGEVKAQQTMQTQPAAFRDPKRSPLSSAQGWRSVRAGLLAYRLRAVGARPVPARWVAVGFGRERRHGRLRGRMDRCPGVVVQVESGVHDVRAQTISTSTEVTGESRTVDATGEWASPHLTSARKSSGATLAAAILTRRRMEVNAAETLSPRPSIPR